ncbi:MAG: alpha/beta fold hydrolase [Candidatus Sericytochromatia bacterium]
MKLISAFTVALSLLLGACGAPGEMLFVRHLNADLPILVQGQVASKKMLVFIHGGPGGTGVTRYGSAAFQALGQHFAVASYDQRMAGLAQGNPASDTLTLEQHVDDLDLVIEVLRQRYPGAKLYLLGHSWGGAVATAYLANPVRQAKITAWMPTDAAYDMGSSLRQSREWVIGRAQARLAQGMDAAIAQEALIWYGQTPVLTGSALVRHFTYLAKLGAYIHHPAAADKPNVGQLLFFGPYSVGSEALNLTQTFQHQSLDRLATLNLSDRLPAITLPSLVMSGRYDGSVPMAASEVLYEALGTRTQDKTLTIFDNSAHRPMDDEPQAFVAAVKAFMDRY